MVTCTVVSSLVVPVLQAALNLFPSIWIVTSSYYNQANFLLAFRIRFLIDSMVMYHTVLFCVYKAVTQLQSVTSVSQPTTVIAISSTMVPQPTAPVPVPTPVAAVESSYFSTAAPTFVPAQATALQQSRPLNEVISSVNSSFNFLQVRHFL
jgi:hypothetical protein